MELTPEISRLAKAIIDAEGVSARVAEQRLRSLTLNVHVGSCCDRATQSALLTAVAVGTRTFLGGVHVRLDREELLVTDLPIGAERLTSAIEMLGATALVDCCRGVDLQPPSATIAIGGEWKWKAEAWAWWDGWKAGSSATPIDCGDRTNPLAAIAGGAAAVARAFASVRKVKLADFIGFDLWPVEAGQSPPDIAGVFLPSQLWLLGIGNLGQAYLWSLSALPYAHPEDVLLLLQDREVISAENWGTSILVKKGRYGDCKTLIGERWALARGFKVRRVDRWLDGQQRRQTEEPAIALCGFDTVVARRLIDDANFEAVVDAGLGRGHRDFEQFRVTVFDRGWAVADHFPMASDDRDGMGHEQHYEHLLGVDACGAAMFEGVSVAAPYVSALAGAMAVARLVAIASGAPVPRTEKRDLANRSSKITPNVCIPTRGMVRQRVRT